MVARALAGGIRRNIQRHVRAVDNNGGRTYLQEQAVGVVIMEGETSGRDGGASRDVLDGVVSST